MEKVGIVTNHSKNPGICSDEKKEKKAPKGKCRPCGNKIGRPSAKSDRVEIEQQVINPGSETKKPGKRNSRKCDSGVKIFVTQPIRPKSAVKETAKSAQSNVCANIGKNKGGSGENDAKHTDDSKNKKGKTGSTAEAKKNPCSTCGSKIFPMPICPYSATERRKSGTPRQCNCNKPEARVEKTCKCIKPGETSGCLCGQCKAPCAIEKKGCKCDVCACGKKSDCSAEPKFAPCCHEPEPEPPCSCDPKPEPVSACGPKPILSCQPKPEPAHTCGTKPEPTCSCVPKPEPACSYDPKPEPARSCETKPQPPRTCAEAVETKPAKQDTCSCNESAKSKIESSKAKGDCPPGKPKEKKCTCSKEEPEAQKLCSCGKSAKKDSKPEQSCGVVEEPPPKKDCCTCLPKPKSKAEGDCPPPKPEPTCFSVPKPEPACSYDPKPVLPCQPKPEPAHTCGPKPEPTRFCEPEPEPACSCDPEPEPACSCDPPPEPACSCEPEPEPPCPCDPSPEPAPVTRGCGKPPEPEPPRTCGAAVEIKLAKQDTCSCNGSAKSKIESSKAKGDCPPGKSKEKKCTCSKEEPEAQKLCSCGKSAKKDPKPKQSCGVVEEPPPKKICCSCQPIPKSKAEGDCPPKKPPASTCACSKMSAATLVSQAVLKIAAKKAAADTCKCNAVHVGGCACVIAARKKEEPVECEHQTRNLLEPQENKFDVTQTVCRKKDVDSSACECAPPKKEDEDISMATLDSVVMSKKVKKFVVEKTCPDACIEEKPEPCPNKPKVDACVCAPEPESDDDECVCTIEPEEKLEDDCACPPEVDDSPPEVEECVCPPEEEIPAIVCPPPEIDECVCTPEEEIPADVCPPLKIECGCPPEEKKSAGVCPPPAIDECGCPPEEESPTGDCPPPAIDDCGCPPEEEIPDVQCACPPEEMEKDTEDEACSCPFKLNINDIQSLTLALDKYITKTVKI